MKKLLLLASLLFATAVASADQTISAERLTRIDRLFQQYVDDSRIGGAVALVLQDGKPVYERAFGWRDKQAGRKMTTDTIFRIASQTKALTSVAILSLMEEGRIGLNDPADRIPTFAKTTVAVARRAGAAVGGAGQTSDHDSRFALTHTAGISCGDQCPRRVRVGRRASAGPLRATVLLPTRPEPICDTMTRLATLPFVSAARAMSVGLRLQLTSSAASPSVMCQDSRSTELIKSA